VTVKINLTWVMVVLGVVGAVVLVLQIPEIKRYLQMETM
jgi:uncharacterized protein DUF6893